MRDATLRGIVAPKNGYIFVYVSNESNLDVFFDNLQVIHKPGAILEETHYYPFGLTMAGISSKSAGSLTNKYKFGGKELNSSEFNDGSGLEAYDFGARNYDQQIGRWWSVDPLADKFPWQSPYTAFDNNPINKIDPDGRAAEVVNKPTDDWLLRKNGDLFLIRRTKDKEHRFFNEKKELLYGRQKEGEEKARYPWNIWGFQNDYENIAKAVSYSKNDVEYEDMKVRAEAQGFPKVEKNTEHTETDYLHDLGTKLRKEDIVMLFAPSPMSKFSPKKYETAIKVLTTLNTSQGGGGFGRAMRVIGDLYGQESPKQYPVQSEGLKNSLWKLNNISTDASKWGFY